MGFDKSSNGGGGGNWVLAEIPLRAPLKPIYTGLVMPDDERTLGLKYDTTSTDDSDDGGSLSEDYLPTTPTYHGSRIPATLPCPPPPRKRKSKPAKCNKKMRNGKRDFFVVPHDLEAVFIRRHNVGC